ncbi:Thioredoxin-like [Arachidicoccus rhizosphaerae]|uniref:Thioredoxin-like n=1 Tax=Arachidicoccus rhizosphaerae TaxID=551991 RepID=A0A1H4BGB1_9BACT|nr:DUF255 domain-containing protein [Arachidicoccus rhizosphaerae]SEA47245.1 Thioredoxin-like [Arachidicoccus rhizosphaerae]
MIKLLFIKGLHRVVRSGAVNRKKALFFVILLTGLLTGTVLTAQTAAHPEIDFFRGTWQQALQEAGKINRPVLAEVGASWCLPCRQLQQETFKDSGVVQFLNKHVITITLDAENKEGTGLVDLWQVSTYPTLLFFDVSGKMLMRYEGFIGSDSLLALAKKAQGLISHSRIKASE